MKIHIYNSQKVLPIPRPAIRKICQAVAEAENESFKELTLHFVTKKRIGRLHAEFFGDPSPTDCITFPVDEKGAPYRVLGEVFICPEVAQEYCLKNQGDPLHETLLYVVHGLLHLFGYDDMSAKERIKMKRAEKRHMNVIWPLD